jgi:hypothetical protein
MYGETLAGQFLRDAPPSENAMHGRGAPLRPLHTAEQRNENFRTPHMHCLDDVSDPQNALLFRNLNLTPALGASQNLNDSC